MNFIYLDENIDETGINVQFEESEDEDEDDVYGEVRDQEEMDEDEEEGVEADEEVKLTANVSPYKWINKNDDWWLLFNCPAPINASLLQCNAKHVRRTLEMSSKEL